MYMVNPMYNSGSPKCIFFFLLIVFYPAVPSNSRHPTRECAAYWSLLLFVYIFLFFSGTGVRRRPSATSVLIRSDVYRLFSLWEWRDFPESNTQTVDTQRAHEHTRRRN